MSIQLTKISQLVFSWKESLLHGGKTWGGSLNLGINIEEERIAELIKKGLESKHFPCLIKEIHLHNGGDYDGGEKAELPEPEFYKIYTPLISKEPKVYFEPELILVRRPL